MLLSDSGEARIGPGPHGGDIMPLEYRAPETLHYVGWSYPVDIWSVGLTVCHHIIVNIHKSSPILPQANIHAGLGPSGVKKAVYSP
jgi:hypothetical protein